MKRFVIAASFVALALAVFAADGGAPVAREQIADSAAAGASLPDLGSRTDAAKTIPLARPRPERHFDRRQSAGPRPYWERDPLFTPTPSP
jgi:hypothetical protein